jgi:hypothetical protein
MPNGRQSVVINAIKIVVICHHIYRMVKQERDSVSNMKTPAIMAKLSMKRVVIALTQVGPTMTS